MKSLNVFMLDDHPMHLEGIQDALSILELEFIYKEATDIDTALQLIKQQPEILPFDIAFIDMGLPPSTITDVHSGEEVALILKEKFPECKIIIPTQYFQAERLRFIIKTVQPDGLLSKVDFRKEHIRNSVKTVLKDDNYYSPSVVKILRSDIPQLDETDLKILYCLSQHMKMKDIPSHVNLSLRAVEDRKSAMMIDLGVPSRNNELLIQVAREKGLI